MSDEAAPATRRPLEPDVHDLAALFKALGDESRLRMVALLAHGELCVCHLVEALGLPQSTVSRQLGVLRQAGLVRPRRDGTWVHYALAPQAHPLRRAQLAALAALYAGDGVLRTERRHLLQACGPGACRQPAAGASPGPPADAPV